MSQFIDKLYIRFSVHKMQTVKAPVNPVREEL